ERTLRYAIYTTRRPGAGRDPLVSFCRVSGWVPAFAGRRPIISDKYTAHATRRITGAGCGADRDHLGDCLGLFRRERDLQRAEVLPQPVDALGPGDRQHVVALRQQPGEAKLRHRAALVRRDRLGPFDQRAVFLEIVALEAWMPCARIAGC